MEEPNLGNQIYAIQVITAPQCWTSVDVAVELLFSFIGSVTGCQRD